MKNSSYCLIWALLTTLFCGLAISISGQVTPRKVAVPVTAATVIVIGIGVFEGLQEAQGGRR